MEYIKNNRRREEIINASIASSYKDDKIIEGILVLSNIRVYLQVNDEEKINEVILNDIKNVRLGGIHVLRLELNNGITYSFFVNHVISWKSKIKKAVKNF